MKCIECKYMTVDDRNCEVECGCSYGSDDGKWNFSVGYLHGNIIEDFLFDKDGCPIDMNVVEQHKRCPL